MKWDRLNVEELLNTAWDDEGEGWGGGGFPVEEYEETEIEVLNILVLH
jgi:hypothetical protein